MSARALRTPLTLAVLSLLRERPRHPYEMKAVVRERHIGEVVKLKGGSLYDAVRRLVAAGLVEVHDVERPGARPERTVYAITDAGVELTDSLVREYLGQPAQEYPVFVAGLAHILNADASTAAELLAGRARAVQRTYDEVAEQLAAAAQRIPRVALLETEYVQTLRRAELDWLRTTVTAIENGELAWPRRTSP